MNGPRTLNADGHAKADVEGVDNVVKLSTRERIAAMKTGGGTANSPETTAELMQRRLDTVDLSVQGVPLRTIADRHGISYLEARKDYFEGMAMLNDRTVDMVVSLRDEITMRQRHLIRTYMPLANGGDEKAARVVQSAENILIGLWGLRSARLEISATIKDERLTSVLDSYLQGAIDATTRD